jgi:hypothetical protein
MYDMSIKPFEEIEPISFFPKMAFSVKASMRRWLRLENSFRLSSEEKDLPVNAEDCYNSLSF